MVCVHTRIAPEKFRTFFHLITRIVRGWYKRARLVVFQYALETPGTRMERDAHERATVRLFVDANTKHRRSNSFRCRSYTRFRCTYGRLLPGVDRCRS